MTSDQQLSKAGVNVNDSKLALLVNELKAKIRRLEAESQRTIQSSQTVLANSRSQQQHPQHAPSHNLLTLHPHQPIPSQLVTTQPMVTPAANTTMVAHQ